MDPSLVKGNQQLYQEVDKSSSSAPSSGIQLDVVRRCVASDVDILLIQEGKCYPPLHRCIINGHVEALKLLLETRRDVDFTMSGTGEFTYPPLHHVAGCGFSVDMKKAMLTAILDRLSSHPNDKVDWSLKDEDGNDFLSYAAFWGSLSAMYPMVKHLPYYVNAAKPIVLTMEPMDMKEWVEDWSRLSVEDQRTFKLSW